MELNQTVLKCGMTDQYIKDVCVKADAKGLYSVSVFPSVVEFAAEALKHSATKVCSSLSYPLGADAPGVKINEAKLAIAEGAQEVCMVINAAAVKMGTLDIVQEEVRGVVEVAHAAGCTAKVMVEMVLLSDEEAKLAIEIADLCGADVIVTSTGFKPLQVRAITEADVALAVKTAKHAKIEAAGTINDRETAEKLAAAGAARVAADGAIEF